MTQQQRVISQFWGSHCNPRVAGPRFPGASRGGSLLASSGFRRPLGCSAGDRISPVSASVFTQPLLCVLSSSDQHSLRLTAEETEARREERLCGVAQQLVGSQASLLCEWGSLALHAPRASASRASPGGKGWDLPQGSPFSWGSLQFASGDLLSYHLYRCRGRGRLILPPAPIPPPASRVGTRPRPGQLA